MTALPEYGGAAQIKAALRCSRDRCACQRGQNVHCPVTSMHVRGDANPSLTVHERAGVVLVNCKTGCTQDAVIGELRRLGLWTTSTAAEVVPLLQARRFERFVALYRYVTADGEVVGEKGRWEWPDATKEKGYSKRFAWRKPGEERWSGGLTMADMPLWGAELVAAAGDQATIVFHEGEAAAQAGRDHGLLSVCAAGGASQKDFGAALECLRGLDVLLWPDNDATGREFMARVHALLKLIAKSVRVLAPPVKNHGDDAVDYFAAGGTTEALFASVPPTEPDVQPLSHDAFLVRYPTGMGLVMLTFAELEKTSREMSCELEVRIEGPGLSRDAYSQRLNLLSSSQRTELRRDLDSIHGKGYEWAAVLNGAIARVRTAFLEQERAVKVADIVEQDEPQFLVETLIPAGKPVVFYADGSAGKTYLLLRMALGVAMGTDVCGLPAMRGAVLFVDYEDDEGNFKRRVGRLLRGLGLPADSDLPLYYLPARGVPLADLIDVVRRMVAQHGISLIIVDAAADACGGEPEAASIALRYFNALDKLPDGVAVATIAHITNANANKAIPDRPFGSAFWRNRPRRLWYVAREQEEGSDVVDLGLYCTKVNDGPKPHPMGFRMTFEGAAGAVTVESSDIQETPGLSQRRPLKAQIWDVLRSGPLTTASIAALVDSSVETVGAALRKNPRNFAKVGEQSRLAGGSPETVWGRALKEQHPTG